jgi:serine/threonine-protein kinase
VPHVTIDIEDIATGESTTFVRDRSPVIIGRGGGATLVIDRYFISGLQGTLRFNDSQITYTDLDSLNGTTIDGKRIERDEAVIITPCSDLVIGCRIRMRVSPGRPPTLPDPAVGNPFAKRGQAASGPDDATKALSRRDLEATEKAQKAERERRLRAEEPSSAVPVAVPDYRLPEASSADEGVPSAPIPRPGEVAFPWEPPAAEAHENAALAPVPLPEAPSPPLGVFPPKTQIGRYFIIRLIESGGMGEVYRAEDPDQGQKVAIKTLLPEHVSRPEARARFENEGRAAHRVNHRNVIKVFGFGVHEGIPYLVMEYLQGKPLDKEMDDGPLSVARAAEILGFVCYGMAAVHDAGIVHRDLKPSNIFLAMTDEGEVVKILDLGVSKVQAATNPLLTASNALIGSYHYMSPEQARGGTKVDERSDQFSIGVIFYEMLAGRRPHDGASTFDILENIVHGRRSRLRDLRPDVPEAVEAVISKAMATDPNDRYESVRRLGQAIVEHAPELVRLQLTALISSPKKVPDAWASQQVPREWFTAAAEKARNDPGSGPKLRRFAPTEVAAFETGQNPTQRPSPQPVPGGTQLLPEREHESDVRRSAGHVEPRDRSTGPEVTAPAPARRWGGAVLVGGGAAIGAAVIGAVVLLSGPKTPPAPPSSANEIRTPTLPARQAAQPLPAEPPPVVAPPRPVHADSDPPAARPSDRSVAGRPSPGKPEPAPSKHHHRRTVTEEAPKAQTTKDGKAWIIE